eukprot:c13083_g1_i1.p1 GENE.c13083_g1_i1~~c13083_g1_i1.p1  ORF type:complete len:425 (+),score=114.21 c13083_g1_i1:40-1314(+)
MARKKVREYHAKRMLARNAARFGLAIHVQNALVSPSTNFEALVKAEPWLLTTRLVVKPDMLFGQRGKNNLILLDASFEDALTFIRERMAAQVTVNGVTGTLTHFVLEPFVPHDVEYYVSIRMEREYNEILFCHAGGIFIEEHWDQVQVAQIPVDADIEMFAFPAGMLAKVAPALLERTALFIKGLYKLFDDLDMTLLECNPFTFTADGAVVLDIHAEVDSTAASRSARRWGDDIEFPHPFGLTEFPEERLVREMDEKTGASLKLTVLNPRGRIWNLVAGGGASVIFADTVADLGFGPELGNYGEYSGAPSAEETAAYARALLDLATREPDGRRRALLIGGGIANFTDIAVTFNGIIHALKEYQDRLAAADFKVFVRRAGPNYVAGLKLMRQWGESSGIAVEVYGPEVAMTTIIPRAVAFIEGRD